MDIGNLEQLHRSLKMQNIGHLCSKGGETMNNEEELLSPKTGALSVLSYSPTNIVDENADFNLMHYQIQKT
jgi:hypothetical protein